MMGILSCQHRPVGKKGGLVNWSGDEATLTYHQTDFEKVRCDAHQNVQFPEKVEIQRRHAIVVGHTREKVHEDELTVSFASVTRLLVLCCLLVRSALDNNDRWRPTASHGWM